MKDKMIVISTLLVASMILSTTAAPSLAFVYPDGSQDNNFEIFGPRVDTLLIKKYASLYAEMTALQNGEIDFTDVPLTKTWIDTLSTDPNIAIVSYGGEAGYYTLNFNNNPNQYLGNPPNPLYPNPVYETNPCVVTEFRQACSYLLDRPALCAGPGQGMYEPIYTPIPAYMGYWISPEISYTGLLSAYAYPPSIADAAAKLDAGHFILTGSPDGYRYWDKNANGVYDGAAEDLNVIFYTRQDALRKGAADMLCSGFDDPAIMVHYTRIAGDGGVAWQKCMVEKDYHMYTSGWIFIGPDPDYLFDLYHWDNYYHPEDPPNFGAISVADATLRGYLAGIKYASDPATALTNCLLAQQRFTEQACECPLASTSSPKAFNKWYTGGNDGAMLGDAEDKYRGQSWTHIVNQMGQGPDNYWTFLNAYPGTYEYGDGNMIARYGWSDNTMPQTLNPMYSSWYWENMIIDEVYTSLGYRDPTLGPVDVPGIAENWTLGTWVDPGTSETLTKVTLKIRPSVLWSDDVPLTMDDVIYTFITMPQELRAKGCPDVWWQPTLDRIVSYFRLDAYTIEILLDVNTYLGANWIAGNIIVPKHIWQPYIATHTIAEITGDFSGQPEMLIGTGPVIFATNSPEVLKLLKYGKGVLGLLSAAIAIGTAVKWLYDKFTEGITINAKWPCTQITPVKIKPAGTLKGELHINIPLTNLGVIDDVEIEKQVDLIKPNGDLVQRLVSFHTKVFSPMQIDNEPFDVVDLPTGHYRIRTTVRIKNIPHKWSSEDLGRLTSEQDQYQEITVDKDFWITVLADLNEDCVVDIFDIVIVCSAYGAALGETLYNPQADVNHDFIIDIFDIVQVALVFGWPG